MTSIVVKKISFACPTQYEGFDEIGFNIYIRYRWGTLTISRYNRDFSGNHEILLCKTIGEEYDGELEDNELIGICERHEIGIKIKHEDQEIENE